MPPAATTQQGSRTLDIALLPDPSRVITRFFVAGREDVGAGDSRAVPVIDRLLMLDEDEAEHAIDDVIARFAHRHLELSATFERHATMVMSRVDPAAVLSPARRQLLGACFTHEFAIEAAALCNPSIVLHPEQGDSRNTRFIMSVRGIGEGHRSSIGFRTGTIDSDGSVVVDTPGPFPAVGVATSGLHHRAVMHAMLAELGDDLENAAYVLGPLPPCFDDVALEDQLTRLATDGATRRNAEQTIDNLRSVAQRSYRVDFDTSTDVSERVLWPVTAAESIGMEDARFVRFDDPARPDEAATYYGTYTAYDGRNIAQHLLETSDFATFHASPMSGDAARGKGLALFPRRVGGRYVALSRSDRETNAVAFSDDLRCWSDAHTFQYPERAWELLQLGNCGSPMETDRGWLVLTHGVGPMRTYGIGAVLLDLDDPRQVLAHSDGPVITPTAGNRDGYVPNVVYTCGGLIHDGTLVLPYGVGDQTIAMATIAVTTLLDAMVVTSKR